MNAFYVVVLLASRTTGTVDSVATSGVFPDTQSCRMMLEFTRLQAQERNTPGYDATFTCTDFASVETLLSKHNCGLEDRRDDKGIAIAEYSCEQPWSAKLSNWIDSFWE